MAWQYTPFTPALAVSTALCVAVAAFVWRRRPAPGAAAGAACTLAIAGWNGAYALELSCQDYVDQLLWANVQYAFIPGVPAFLIAFALTYTGREGRLTRPVIAALAVEPAVTWVLAWGSDALPWLRAGGVPVAVDGFTLVAWQYGPFFWFHLLYCYGLMLAATVLLLPVILRSPYLYRLQAAAVALGILAPWIANVVYVLDLSPFPHLDLTPFSFFVFAAAIAWGLFRFQLLDVVPVARDRVFDELRDGVVVVGTNDRIADVNPAAARLFGRGASDLIGRPARPLLPTLDGGEVCVDLGADGGKRVYELRLSAVHDRRGRLRGRVAVLHDLTERHQAEEERLRTQRLRAAGELAAGIGHNLNNILIGILAPAQRLSEGDGSNLQRDAGLIRAAAERARDLVQRLNRGTGDADAPPEPVDVAAAVREAIDTARPRWQDEPLARGGPIRLATDLAEVPLAACTAAGLHDVLLNLLFNAVDAMPRGGVLRVAARSDGDWVLLCVGDTGVGMDEETRRRVFEPFFTTKVDVGSGLGLSTAYRTVQRWGGQFQVDSDPGRGSVFQVALPLWQGPPPRRDAARREEPRSDAPAPASAPRGTTPRARILIAEDEAVVAMVLADCICRLGHACDVVGSGDLAVERLPGGYDVAILDLGIPEVTGDCVAAHGRRLDPDLTTVLMTGWTLDAADPRREGFDFCIQKPFDTRQVERIITRAVDLRQRRRAAR